MAIVEPLILNQYTSSVPRPTWPLQYHLVICYPALQSSEFYGISINQSALNDWLKVHVLQSLPKNTLVNSLNRLFVVPMIFVIHRPVLVGFMLNSYSTRNALIINVWVPQWHSCLMYHIYTVYESVRLTAARPAWFNLRSVAL